MRVLAAIIALPGTVTLLVPALLLSRNGWNPVWGLAPPYTLLLCLLGTLLALGGLALMAWTIILFATRGRGTLAPWDPAQTLVVDGPYRHVRNPMISGVVAVLLGEAVLAGSPPLVVWFLLFVLANAIYIPAVEEPGLRRRFGKAYVRYCQDVPRWIPRRTPWMPPSESR